MAKDVTLAIIRQGSGFDFNTYVDRVFKTDDAAFKVLEKGNYHCVRIEGKWKKGDKLPMVGNSNRPRMESIDAYYTTGYKGLLSEGS